tara:strand:+ start:2075 stop:2374 length:300 start_codon:yes stop_codon:yes gene_type:complete
MKKLWSHDPVTGIKKYWHVTGKGEYVVETVMDVKPIVEANKKQRNNMDKRHKDVNKVASIPLPIYYELKRKGIADDPKALFKWLNDSDNAWTRTRESTL